MSSKKQLAENDDVSALSPDGGEDLEVWPFWKLCIIALPQLGVQVLWIFLGPHTTPYLKKLGGSDSFATLNNLAGPIVGFFVGPIIGAWSDQSEMKLGRRRPIIVAGLISTVVAGLLYSGAEQIMGKGNGLYLAASMQWVLDFTINAMQTPFRALVADLASPEQQLSMQMFFQVVCAAGGFLAFTISTLYKVPTNHMLELMMLVLAIIIVCVGLQFLVAREKQFKRPGSEGGLCNAITGMAGASKGMPKAFFILLGVNCFVWFANTFWSTYAEEWFTTNVYEGQQHAPVGSEGLRHYEDGVQAFNLAGQWGSVLQLVLSLMIMGISMTKFPQHLLYAMFIWIGAATCLYAAFAVGHSGLGAIIAFILSNNENVAALSIPYGLVAVWNKAAEEAGHVGSVAMQMAILNCTITIGQQACTLLLGALESLGHTENDSLTQLLIISGCSSTIVGFAALFLKARENSRRVSERAELSASLHSRSVGGC